MQKFFTIILLTFFSFQSFSQITPDRLKIFIDCEQCDDEQIRQQLKGVDYVHDQFQANLQIQITRQQTGSGGNQINVHFLPNSLPGMDSFTLTRYTPADATTDMERIQTLAAIRFGLMPFLFSTGQEQMATIDMDQSVQAIDHQMDPWNFWLFSISTSGEFEAEDSQHQSEAGLELRAERTTEIWRIESELNLSNELKWARDEEREIRSMNNEMQIRASLVYSLSNHWSAGVFGEFSSDTYKNLKTGLSAGPAIEYNFFPWKESDRRRFTISYYLHAERQVYLEETIYDRTDETLAKQAVRTDIQLIQPWGDFEVTLEGRNYLHDFDRYGLSLKTEMGIRIFKGLSVFMAVEAESVHDQLYLPRGNSSIEDILIQRRKQATAYEFQGELGFRYSFGSIYNNVVNLRL